MTFHKGESGNPAGRRRGSRNRTTILMQSLLEADGEALARKAIDLAKGGDLAALRMCMDRLVPARKHEPIAVDLPRLDTAADTVTAASTIVAAVAAGELAPAEGADIAKVVDIYVRALATQEFEERLAKLENDPAPPACRLMPTHDGNVDGRSPTHAAAAAAVAEPAEQARESSRPQTPDFFHLEGPWGYARRHRGQARSPARRGNGAGGRQVHSHPLAAPGRKLIDQA